MKKKVLGILLALCAALSLAPVTALAAGGSTVTAVKSVGLGTSMLPDPEVPKDVDTDWKGSYVYYGIYKGEPIKFRMLSKRTTDFGGETMLLDCDTALLIGSNGGNPDGYTGIFGSTNIWADSDIREYLDGTFLTKYFSRQEQAGIASSTKTAPGASDGRGFISCIIRADNTRDYYERALFCPLNGEKIFLMDAKELTNTSYGYFCTASGEMKRSKSIAKAPSGSAYLIRSKYWNGTEYVCSIDNGVYDDDGFVYYAFDVSPALNIELSSVLFTTAAESGKVIELDGNVPATRTNRTDAYKLTLLDGSRNFSVSETRKEGAHGNAITLTYSNAVVGENEYISAMIVNDKNEVLNYGPLKAVDAAAGTVEMIIPFNIASGTYTLKLFNEHINGDFKTDYASAFADVTLSVNSAIGKNGEDGVTPILKIGTDNIWYVSYDKGVTWTSLGTKATGAQGDKGEKGDTGAQGEKGNTGAPGADGSTPRIGDNGDWWIGDVDTGVNATGNKGDKGEKGDKGDRGDTGAAGADGVTPLLKIGTDNIWCVSYDGGVTWVSLGVNAAGIKGDTGAAGKDGRDGLIPHIGSNGNWWLGETDTGVRASVKGDKGDTGATGATGAAGASGRDGRDGQDGRNGRDGVGIARAEINDSGELVLTYTDGTTANLGKVVGADGADGLTPYVGDNGNWWIGGTDTGVRAAAGTSTATVIALAAAGAALAGNAALAACVLRRRRSAV